MRASQAVRFLLHSGFSAPTRDILFVMREGFNAWLSKEFAKPIQISSVDWLYSQGHNNKEQQNVSYGVNFIVWQQLVESDDVLRKRVSLALSEILVVSGKRINLTHRPFTMAYYWDILNNHAFGNYKDLLKAISLCPATGSFLTYLPNRIQANKKHQAPDENYARELLQLFSIGLIELEENGQPLRDKKGNLIETYDQRTISELAHVFTGFELDTTHAISVKNPKALHSPMQIRPEYHSQKEINISSQNKRFKLKLKANTEPQERFDKAIDAIFAHPNIAPFVSKQLILKLTTSNPSPDYIQRVAAVFNDNGKGVKGDMKSVIRAILLDGEVRSASSLVNPNQGKVREPFLRLLHWTHSFSARRTNDKNSAWQLPNMGSQAYGFYQMPLFAPSVFNFFRPGFTPSNSALSQAGLIAPEIQIINETSVASYYNNIQVLINQGVAHYQGKSEGGLQPDYSAFMKLAKQGSNKLVNRLALQLTAQQLSKNTLDIIKEAVAKMKSDTEDDLLKQIKATVFLIMTSYDYLLQK